MNVFASGLPINVVVDGNSMTTNLYGTIGTFDNHLMTVEPLKSSGATHVGLGTPGHRWDWMNQTADAAAVDNAWQPGAENVLVLWEHTNSINALSVADTIGYIEAYLDARLAVHPWKIIMLSAPPRDGSSGWRQKNLNMLEVNQWCVDNAARFGMENIDVRQLPVFNYLGDEPAPFLAVESWAWHEKGSGWLHPLDEPKLQVAELVVRVMQGLPAFASALTGGLALKVGDGAAWKGATWRTHNGTSWVAR